MAKSAEETQLIIQDACLGNFYIKVDPLNFSVHKKTESQYERMADGHFTTLEGALRYISRQLVLSANVGNILSIKQYLDEFKDISDTIQTKIEKR